MSDEASEKRSSGTGRVMGIVVAMILYILAPGPLLFLCQKKAINYSTVSRIYQIGWWPMEYLYFKAKPVEKFYTAYFNALGISWPFTRHGVFLVNYAKLLESGEYY